MKKISIKQLIFVALAVAVGWMGSTYAINDTGTVGDNDTDIDRDTIHWPSDQFPSMRSAVQAVPEGGRLLIAPGTHRIEETINITKRITIEGAGCRSFNRLKKRPFTRLEGPTPSSVIDEDNARGMFKYVGPTGGGILMGLELVGFDVAVVTDSADEGSSALTIQNTCIMDTGYGILSRGGLSISVIKSSIYNVLQNGIRIIDPEIFASLYNYSVIDVFILQAGEACIYVENTSSVIAGSLLARCGPAGGIAGVDSQVLIIDMGIVDMDGPGIILVRSTATILESAVNTTTGFGVLLVESPSILKNTSIVGIRQTPAALFGDGIAALLTPSVTLIGNDIRNSDRAGIAVFGSQISFQHTEITCSALDLVAEEYNGVDYSVQHLGDNKCGCPSANDDCILESPGIAPPPPVSPP